MTGLAPRAGDAYLDCTTGLGGHAEAAAARVGASGTVVLNDLDAGNLEAGRARLAGLDGPPRVVTLHGNFADAPRRMVDAGLSADCVVADLGFASNQVDDAARGLSFMREGPLDMRLDRGGTTRSAADLVNTLSEPELGEIIREYGEEKAWRAIAAKIVSERAAGPISTTSRLASIVRSCLSRHASGGIDPATRTFQALRIAVNDELGSLRSLTESVLRAATLMAVARRNGAEPPRTWLRPGARVAIISFHSLEDRLVKDLGAALKERRLGEALSRRPVEAGDPERDANPRSRSAKLRVFRLTDATGR